jgi:hypothetical protein
MLRRMKDFRRATSAAVRSAITREFGLQIPSSKKKSITDISAWKKSTRVKECYRMLYDENESSVSNITKTAFSNSMPLDDPPTFNKVFIYIAAICDIILNPDYPEIECSRKSLERCLQVFKVIF